jgi:predicted amidohydrolase YtcJ
VASNRPLHNIKSAVLRRTRSGTVPGEDQRISLEEGFTAYTADAAHSVYRERWAGRLRPGSVADLVLIEGDVTSVPIGKLDGLPILVTLKDGVAVT